MHIEQVLDQRPLQPRPPAAVKQEAAAGELGAPGKVDEAK